MVAFEPSSSVSSTAHVVARGQVWGRVKGDTKVSKGRASYRLASTPHRGGFSGQEGGLPEGPPDGTGRETDGGVLCTPGCGVRGIRHHYVVTSVSP